MPGGTTGSVRKETRHGARGIHGIGTVGMTATLALLGALINLTGPGHFIDWGFIQLSVANFVVICLMVVTFVAAILLPLPSRRSHHDD